MAIITGDDGDNLLEGSNGTDIMFGLGGDDVLLGNDGNDILIGGPGGGGLDQLVGGSGIDAASYQDSTAGVTADFLIPQVNTGDAEGDLYSVENLIGSDFDDTLRADNDANLINGGFGNDSLAGRGGIDDLFGGAGDDRLDGGDDADRLFGGIGSDAADYSAASAGVGVNLTFIGFAGDAIGDTYFDIEVVIGSNFLDTLYADDLANSVFGLAGNDTIRGFGGNDLLYGGEGFDTILGNEGDDQLFGGLDSDSLDGGDGGDLLFGGDSGDSLNGGAGADVMYGEAGADTYYVDDDGDVVDETFAGSNGIDTVVASIGFNLSDQSAAIGSVEKLRLIGNDDLNGVGNALDNYIEGNDGDNILTGGGGNDTFFGGDGADRLIGGVGNDNYFAGAGDAILEQAGEGYDYVETYLAAYTLGANLEALYFLNNMGGGVRTGKGNALDNTITGTKGDDRLFGLAGDDILWGYAGRNLLDGGTGNDTFIVEAADTIVERAGEGYDTVRTKLAAYTLANGVERLYTDTTAGIAASGNALANTIYGNNGDDRFRDYAGGADRFSGGNGSDSMYFTGTGAAVLNFATGVHGGSAAGDLYASIENFFGSNTGGDTMTAGAGRAIFNGQGGNDTLAGGASGDSLFGGAGTDTLNGGANNDALQGGAQNDTLTGGAGRDYFVYAETAASGGWGADTITDFQDGVDFLKFATTAADAFADFTITGNGTTDVLLKLAAAPANTIALHGAAPITVTAADFLFV